MKKRRGFTLIEILIVAVLLAVGLLPLLMVNRSSNKLTLDAYYEFLAVQLAQEPIEVFRSVGYPECENLANYRIGSIEPVSNQDGRYPVEVEMFERQITLTRQDPLCLVTVRVFPKADSSARAWMRQGKEAVIMRGVVPYVR